MLDLRERLRAHLLRIPGIAWVDRRAREDAVRYRAWVAIAAVSGLLLSILDWLQRAAFLRDNHRGIAAIFRAVLDALTSSWVYRPLLVISVLMLLVLLVSSPRRPRSHEPRKSRAASSEPSAEIRIERDEAWLRFRNGEYSLRMRKELTNVGDQPVLRFLTRVAVDRYPDDASRSNEHYRKNPLTIDELGFQASCEGRPMRVEVKEDRDSSKEFWLYFENDQERFPLFPSTTATIDYRYRVGEDKWGPWFQRAIRHPTKRIAVYLSFPRDLAPSIWGVERSGSASNRPLEIHHMDSTSDEMKTWWIMAHPRLQSRFRFEWSFGGREDRATSRGEMLRRRIAAMGIRQDGDAVLTRPVRPFQLPEEKKAAVAIERELIGQIAQLKQVHPFSKGIGLAAPQIGHSRSIAVVQPADEDGFITLVNPEIVWQSEEEDEQFEGCLSLFDRRGRVRRPLSIRVRTLDVRGRKSVRQFDRAVARLVLHEIDHLFGQLYVDKVEPGTIISLDEYEDIGDAWNY